MLQLGLRRVHWKGRGMGRGQARAQKLKELGAGIFLIDTPMAGRTGQPLLFMAVEYYRTFLMYGVHRLVSSLEIIRVRQRVRRVAGFQTMAIAVPCFFFSVADLYIFQGNIFQRSILDEIVDVVAEASGGDVTIGRTRITQLLLCSFLSA